VIDLRGGRRTVQFYRQRRDGSIYRLVMTRDAHLGLVPIGGRSSDTAFAVKLHGDTTRELELVQLLARSSMDYGLSEAACGLIEQVAEVLVSYGEASYELFETVVRERTEGSEGSVGQERARLELDLVPPLSLHRFGPGLFQIAPADGNGKVPRLLRVPADRIWTIRLPRSLGGSRGQRRMLRQLDRLERRSRCFNMNPTAIPVGYDFVWAQRAVAAAAIRKTRRWGVVEQPSMQEMTSYYTVAGRIENRRAQARLRDHIVAGLNEFLRSCGLPAIEIEGAPSEADIASVLARLEAGELDLVTANKLTRLP
jgi:hypothetical protein